MRKLFLAAIATFVLCVSAFGSVEIEKKCRIQNMSPGYCAWCCLETLGRNQNIKQLVGLTKARTQDADWIETQFIPFGGTWVEQTYIYPKNVGYIPAIKQKLDLLNVKYKITTWDRDHIKEAVNKNGCSVFMRSNELMKEPHAIILTDYNDKKFQYIDPNGCDYWEGTREWFDSYWDGIAISIEG